MNRHERRRAERELRKHGPGLVAEPICDELGHDYPDVWTMRPAIVGAGISIPKVHFDRRCRRCRQAAIVWADIQGDTSPFDQTMTLSKWLEAHNALVAAPPGEVRVPDMADVATRLIQAADAANDAANPAGPGTARS